MTTATAAAMPGGFTFGLVPRETVFGMTGLEFLRKLVDRSLPAPPFAEAADIWITEVAEGRAVFEGKPSLRFYNPLGSVHGGWISTLLDSAMGCAVHTVLKAGQVYTTVDMNVSFVRPVFDKSGVIRCEGKIIHAGSRIATSEGRVWDKSGALIAHGTETCAIMNLPGAK